MFACTRLDCPLEVVARRDKKQYQLRRQKSDLHAAQVRERKAAQEQFRKDECKDELKRRACAQRPAHTNKSAQRELARLEVLQRKRQLEAVRAEQLKWELENKQQRFKPRTRTGTPQGNQKQEKVQQNRREIIQKRQEQVENEFHFNEYKAELRIKDIKDSKKLQCKKLYETSKVLENKVKQKRDELIKKEQGIIKNELMIKDLRTAQNLGIEIKPVIKKKYVPRPKPEIVKEIVTEFDIKESYVNLNILKKFLCLGKKRRRSKHTNTNELVLSQLDKDLELWGFEPRKVLPFKGPPCRPRIPGEPLETPRTRPAVESLAKEPGNEKSSPFQPLKKDTDICQDVNGEPLERDVDLGKVKGSPCDPLEEDNDICQGLSGEPLEKNDDLGKVKESPCEPFEDTAGQVQEPPCTPRLDGERLERGPETKKHKNEEHWVTIEPENSQVPETFENYVSLMVHALPDTEESELRPECDNLAVWRRWRREVRSRVVRVPDWQVREEQRAAMERSRVQRIEYEREFAAACMARGDACH